MGGPLTLGVTSSLFSQPLLYGLEEKGSLFEFHVDLPAQLSRLLSQRIPPLSAGCALLSPLDYCRYGGNYRIVPRVCVSSSLPSGTVRLCVKSDIRNIRSVAVDVRVTSEILLAKILLIEKFENLSASKGLVILPMMPDLHAMLSKADAALIVNLENHPPPPPDVFCLDLVEEWSDLTGLPYVHGFWVYHDGDVNAGQIRALREAGTEGGANLETIADQAAARDRKDPEAYRAYLSKFSTVFDTRREESLREFFHYLFYHQTIGDVPDLVFGEDVG